MITKNLTAVKSQIRNSNLSSALMISDELHDLAGLADFLVENHVVAVDNHLVLGTVNFSSELHQINFAARPFGAGLQRTRTKIIDVGETPKLVTNSFELAKINLTIIQKHGLVGFGSAGEEFLAAQHDK